MMFTSHEPLRNREKSFGKNRENAIGSNVKIPYSKNIHFKPAFYLKKQLLFH